jgi:hypothetical protein
MIICAACRIKNTDIIVCGARHFDKVMRSVIRRLDYKVPPSDWEQGFIDQMGEFYTRRQAMDVVNMTGQVIDIIRNGSEIELYSEGLY